MNHAEVDVADYRTMSPVVGWPSAVEGCLAENGAFCLDK